MDGFSGLLLDHPGGGEVRLSLKLSCCVTLGLSCLLGDTLGLGVGKGVLLCRCCFRFLLSGYAGGNSIPCLLECGIADLGLGK